MNRLESRQNEIGRSHPQRRGPATRRRTLRPRWQEAWPLVPAWPLVISGNTSDKRWKSASAKVLHFRTVVAPRLLRFLPPAVRRRGSQREGVRLGGTRRAAHPLAWPSPPL